MLKRIITLLLFMLLALCAALPAQALSGPMRYATPMTYDAGTVTDGLLETFPGIKLLNTSSGNPLGFTDAPRMNKYRYALPGGKGGTLTLYFYPTAANMRIAKGYVDGYALLHNGQRVYAASEQPYTYYADNVSSLFLYCGVSKAVNKKLEAFTENPPVGGYFAGDKWVKPFPVPAVKTNALLATVIRDTPVYGGASKKYETLGTLLKGTRVELITLYEDQQWANIRSDNPWSCVPADSLRPDRPQVSQTTLVYNTDDGYVGVGKMTAAINVRTGPGTSYNKLGKIKKGTLVAVDEMISGWARLRSYGTLFGPAWVSAQYIQWETGMYAED